MGAEPYYYFVPYQADIDAALRTLRQREFEAGRYNPVMPFPSRFLTARNTDSGGERPPDGVT